MTEKRFVHIERKGNDYILDNPNYELDFIEMLGDSLESEEIVDLLNSLNDENEQLKQRIKELEKDSFLCLDCEYCGNVEIGCLCNHNDDWVEFVTECDDFKKELYE